MPIESNANLKKRYLRFWVLNLMVMAVGTLIVWFRVVSLDLLDTCVLIALILGQTMVSVFAWRNWTSVEEKIEGSERDLANLRSIVEASQDAVFDLTADGLITRWSKGAKQLYGYSPKQVFGLHFSVLFNSQKTHEATRLIERVLAGQNVTEHETQHVRKDGEQFDVSLTICPTTERDEAMSSASVVIRDITPRQRAAESMAQQAAAMTASMDGMAIIDPLGTFVYLNDAYSRAYGYGDSNSLIGASWEHMFNADELARLKDNIMPAVWRDGSWRGEAFGKRRDGISFPVEISISAVAGGGVVHVVRDISERKRAEENLQTMSLKDELTGLFNRRGLLKNANRYFDFARRQKESLLLVFIDLDGMKRINDEFGHNEGDNALIQTAAILKNSFREDDIIARLGGDEFTVLVTGAGADGEEVLETLNRHLDEFNLASNLAYKLSFSAGVAALNPGNMTCFEELLEQADQTMYQHKRNKRRKNERQAVPVKDVTLLPPVAAIAPAVTTKDFEALLLNFDPRKSDEYGTFDQAAIGMAVVAADGSWLQINESLCNLLGYSEQELRGMTFQQLTHPDDLKRAEPQVARILRGDIKGHQQEKRYFRKDGQMVWVSWNVSILGNGKGTRQLFFQVQDITDRKEAEERLRQDVLTGLPNRGRFNDFLKLRATRVENNKEKPFAVLFLDVDRFKVVNDSLGHLSGDQLLRQIADRLTACMRQGDIVGRVGGDEFALVLDDVSGKEEACSVAARIQQDLSMSFNLFGQEVYATVSIGIALSSDYTETATDMLRDAETAMHQAKRSGRARYEMFGRAMQGDVKSLLRMETDMRHAIERLEFFVQYQPVVALKGNKLIGFEALARWQHPEFGVISPLEFIPLAEETGQIQAIGQLILREACRQAREWLSKVPSTPPLFVSVNLSVKQFMEPDLVNNISALLKEFNLPAECLKLEITESVFTQNVEAAVELLTSLRTLGVQLSIDDFGTGYSSLSYLHRFPINTLKIDRSFVTQMAEHVENVEIVRTIVMLAQNLGMDVVAEGVETKEQLALLRRLGCENGQGFLFSPPLRLEDVGGFIANGDFGNLPAIGAISAANFQRPALVA